MTKTYYGQRGTRLKETPKSLQATYLKVLDGRANTTVCIKMMCLQCMGYDKSEIKNCVSLACPLWHRRPYQGGG